MTSDRLTSFLQIAANIGIIVGLVMVALQMRQNEELLQLQLTNQYYENYINSENSLMAEGFAEAYRKSVEEPQNMTYTDIRIMEAQTFAPLTRWIGAYRMYEAGLMDASLWKTQVKMDTAYYFGNVYGRAWWQYYRERLDPDFLPAELRNEVDERLASAPLNTNLNSFDTVRDYVRQIQEQAKVDQEN